MTSFFLELLLAAILERAAHGREEANLEHYILLRVHPELDGYTLDIVHSLKNACSLTSILKFMNY